MLFYYSRYRPIDILHVQFNKDPLTIVVMSYSVAVRRDVGTSRVGRGF